MLVALISISLTHTSAIALSSAPDWPRPRIARSFSTRPTSSWNRCKHANLPASTALSTIFYDLRIEHDVIGACFLHFSVLILYPIAAVSRESLQREEHRRASCPQTPRSRLLIKRLALGMNGNERRSQQSENNLSSTLPTGSPGPDWPVAGGGGTPATYG